VPARAPRELRTAVGLVFQNPRLATDPRLTLREIVAEPLRATGRGRDPEREADAAYITGASLNIDGGFGA
jgi:peptide/nickel transport system ATP-binding protein